MIPGDEVYIVQRGDVIVTVYRGTTSYSGEAVHITGVGVADMVYESLTDAHAAAAVECERLSDEYAAKASRHRWEVR